MLNFRDGRKFVFDSSERVRNRETIAEQNFVGLTQRGLRLVCDSITLHTDFVNRPSLGWIAVGQHEGRNVLHNFRAAANHRHFANATELMNRDDAANNCVIFDGYMSGKGADIGHDDIVSQAIVMGDVGVGHVKAVAPDPVLGH